MAEVPEAVLPTPPHISVGDVPHILEELTAELQTQRGGVNQWVLIGARLELDDWHLAFHLVLVPTEAALKRLQSA